MENRRTHSYKNILSNLKFKHFQSWDDELAYLAALKAKTCIPGHDYCRNTGEGKLNLVLKISRTFKKLSKPRSKNSSAVFNQLA